MDTGTVLVLNRSYFPVHITTVKRAFVMLYQGLAKAVDDNYRAHTFETWADLAVEANHPSIGLVDRLIRIPRVVLLTAYDRVPQRGIRFSRRNIMVRDKYQCQYCGLVTRSDNLNLDHVLPRTLGGRTTWENITTSCIECNRRKGGRTPEQAHMKLLRRPYRPTALPFLSFGARIAQPAEWKPFLSVVDYSYWNVELKDE